MSALGQKRRDQRSHASVHVRFVPESVQHVRFASRRAMPGPTWVKSSISQRELNPRDGSSLPLLGGVSHNKKNSDGRSAQGERVYRCEASSSVSSTHLMICARVGLRAPLLKSSEELGSPAFS